MVWIAPSGAPIQVLVVSGYWQSDIQGRKLYPES